MDVVVGGFLVVVVTSDVVVDIRVVVVAPVVVVVLGVVEVVVSVVEVVGRVVVLPVPGFRTTLSRTRPTILRWSISSGWTDGPVYEPLRKVMFCAGVLMPQYVPKSA